jgi:SNF2 family DNA or RNA helicase
MVSKIINKEIELARQEQRPMKTVIFSQWTSSMNALEPVIYEKFGNDPNMNIARIDGALKNLDDR